MSDEQRASPAHPPSAPPHGHSSRPTFPPPSPPPWPRATSRAPPPSPPQRASPETDGYAAGITLLMCLTGLPVGGLRRHCQELLRSADAPERWRPPGVPDARAGWPPAAAVATVRVVQGLAPLNPYDERLPLGEAQHALHTALADAPPDPAAELASTRAAAFEWVEAAVAAPAAPASTAATAAAAAAHAAHAGGELRAGSPPGAEEERECMVCMEAPREVRFYPCSHASCCRSCAAELRAAARACPVCRQPIREWADVGRHVASQPTHVQPRRPLPQGPTATDAEAQRQGHGRVGMAARILGHRQR